MFFAGWGSGRCIKACVEYKPGDVVNGHVLGDDNAWHPVQPPTCLVVDARRAPGYGHR